ncbi:GNAT family N-acetyltransferase [Pontibacillus marinus]|uniref:Acyltransferase n=1 Tax=Pontibacillus marinus BH030004 = DSM 16465 TaxID=1385511 RepID=A0A0A5HLU6_9BACI|nr:GNAT family N-acetyltransferase [Pontibacillus marinus]KGX84592.1 acyltransferase [Pontibacillus marinus BH030004 = DSM 16465]
MKQANKHVRLTFIQDHQRHYYMEYLLLADESEIVISEYINDGDMFAVYAGELLVGVALFTFHSDQIVELKNIAISPTYRGQGVGKAVIQEACSLYRGQGLYKMIVGTANSSIANIAFYQKVGFRMAEVKRDFFLNYPEPIFEDGIRALDMIMFDKILNERKY